MFITALKGTIDLITRIFRKLTKNYSDESNIIRMHVI